jgi:hypothetical protein
MIRIAILLAVLALPLATIAYDEGDDDAKASGSGLVVEQVRWEPEGDAGAIHVQFKLVGVKELPKHPSITYVVEEASGSAIQLQRPVMLPPTADNAEDARSATMVLPDPNNLVRPGSTVTVVVAGLIRKGIPVEGEVPAEGVPVSAKAEPETDAKLEVVKLMVSGGGGLLDLRYRLDGLDRVRADEGDSYIEVPETGQKLFVLGVARIGTLATKDAGSDRTSYVLFKNNGNQVKVGDRVNVVIAGVRQQDVLVEK